MIANLGLGLMAITVVVALYGVFAAVYGALGKRPALVESARLAMMLTFPLVLGAAVCIVILLLTGQYQYAYVYNVTSSSMPTYLKITALWGGQAGSLLFWSLLMSAFASAVTLRNWDRDREFLPWVIVVAMVTLVFFLLLSFFGDNPFTRFFSLPNGTQADFLFPPAGAVAIFPPDGQGLNPLLRHPGMVIHPPMLYLGFVSFVIPFAFAIASLITGRSDDRWIRITRRWTLIAWLFLSLGLVLGSRWAYDVLGWGGYWGWDPVEIAAFMPWLTGTAFLHSVMIQEKRNLFKRWNMILVILTYSLVIFGTFLTRSGVLSSVHAFAQSTIGPPFFVFIAVTFLISLGLLVWRWEILRADGKMTSLLSRESLFLFNNLLFIGILIVCLSGVIYPIVSELLTGQKVTVGPPFYKSATGPLFALLLVLMGIAPLSAWGRSTWKTIGRAIWKPLAASLIILVGIALWAKMQNPLAIFALWLAAAVGCITLYEYGRGVFARHRATKENLVVSFWRLAGKNRRRYGGYIIHLGVVLMALGIIGMEFYQTETQATIPQGGTMTLDNYTIKFVSLDVFDTNDGRNVARAVVDVFRNGQPVGQLYPRHDYFYDAQQPMTIPGVRSTLEDDVYVLLVGWDTASTAGVTFKVFHNPLINWLWIGALVFILGSLVAAWPGNEAEAERARAAEANRLAARPV